MMERRDANQMPGGRRGIDPRSADAIMQRTPQISGSGDSLIHTHTGTIIERRKKPVESAAVSCPFGQIVATPAGTEAFGISGGAITIGNKNFHVEPYPIVTTTDGTWLVEISISGVSFNTDDDDSLVLPGITTATGTPTWAKNTFTGSESYTSSTLPSTPTGTGTIILPIGRLTVANGSPSLVADGCGSFFVTQCAGIFSYSRVSE